jgi:hypothetical protein
VTFNPANQTKTITSPYRAISGATRASFAVYATLLDPGIVPIGLVSLSCPYPKADCHKVAGSDGYAVVCVIVSHTGVVVPL